MTKAQSLVDQFLQAIEPVEKTVSIKFRTENQVVFEIEVSSNGGQAFNAEVFGIVEQAIGAAVSKLK